MLSVMIILSSMLAVSSSCWMVLWVFMEMNTLMMCLLMNSEMNKDKSNSPPAFLYYLVQCTASIIFLCVAYSHVNNESLKEYIMLICMLVKMGVWPFHAWYLKIISMLSMKTNSLKMIMTWQKVIPLLTIPALSLKSESMCMTMCMVNMAASSLSVSSFMSFKSIMGMSSMFNNSWLLITTINTTLMLVFFSVYSMSLLITLSYLEKMKTKKSLTQKNLMLTTAMGANLSGVPPMIMFSAKVYVLKTMVGMNLTMAGVYMVLVNCLFSYHYLWGLMNLMSTENKKTQNTSQTNSVTNALLLLSSSTLGLLLLF
uniref:NADH-ubiquinone oxidoreductase chain 2 n=1 Tax=Histiostomatidae sp. XFX TaxID=2652661 RepID=A0A5J6VCZ6_9ACAR|nr:NADH dehydrogenase subunit 2 [Histiostomatidae sp. XFX]